MFTVHSRGVFTQEKSGYFSNSKVGPIRKKWDREKVFTIYIKGCSLIRGVHCMRGFTVVYDYDVKGMM